MSEKQISIIIPCYNVEQYLDRCFDSLKNQTLGIDKLELIFINDASTDNTLSKLVAFEKAYPDSVLVINLEENRGQGFARNIAMQYVSADYVGFVDSDDFIDVDMYQSMLDVIKKHDCDFVECDWDFFSALDCKFTKNSFEIKIDGYADFSEYKNKEEYIIEQLFFTSMGTKLFKRDFILENNIFCPEGLKYEDMFFCYLSILYAKSYYHVNKYFYHYFQNPEGTVQKRNMKKQLDMMEVSLLFLEECKTRGLYEQYKNIVEWMFLEKYYIYMIWDIWDIFPEEAYKCYQELKVSVKELIPDYKDNPYRNLEFNQLDNFILKLIDFDLKKEQFEDIMKQLKQQQKNVKR